MKLIKIFGTITLFCGNILCDTNSPYDYNLNGADWGKHFPDCGNGGAQSPIDLRTYLHGHPFPNVTMPDEL